MFVNDLKSYQPQVAFTAKSNTARRTAAAKFRKGLEAAADEFAHQTANLPEGTRIKGLSNKNTAVNKAYK